MSETPRFHPDMTIAEAMQVHPRVSEVFASFHLGGCSSCSISYHETIRQVALGYGVPVDVLMETLNSLASPGPAARKSTEAEGKSSSPETPVATG